MLLIELIGAGNVKATVSQAAVWADLAATSGRSIKNVMPLQIQHGQTLQTGPSGNKKSHHNRSAGWGCKAQACRSNSGAVRCKPTMQGEGCLSPPEPLRLVVGHQQPAAHEQALQPETDTINGHYENPKHASSKQPGRSTTAASSQQPPACCSSAQAASRTQPQPAASQASPLLPPAPSPPGVCWPAGTAAPEWRPETGPPAEPPPAAGSWVQ